jgi:hypothetical protein
MKFAARLDGCVMEQFNVRSNEDRRKKCDRYIYSYRYLNYEWRRSLEVPVLAKPFPKFFIEVEIES